ncbi:putative glycosyltransferase [Sphingobium sp. SYK-6]|uniref:glycosyltransferase family 2 protein n=1 Tax=Sphingobium sp. (strain NBRC 103272 / SYK-6) TaxID=627192 RepID=UPI000227714C|nr:glycosyltransferase family 2 protein [Sphingobium sp. SYK-6]BAK66912.1 putative glycosyltransferase [Sphingobium sp. SYK-6]
MRSSPEYPYPLRIASRWLKLSIHADAFRSNPPAYLTALWWRLCRKKVRSRSQLAPLLGTSRRAYDAWVLRKEKPNPPDHLRGTAPSILALVEGGADQALVEQTLRNLASEGLPSLVIGSENTPTLSEAIQKIDWSVAPWLMPIAAGDKLAASAASAYRAAISGTESRLVYADDDLLTRKGRRTAPHFKPDGNSELFCHFDYLSGTCVLRASRDELEAIAGANDWMRQLVFQAMGKEAPLHVRKILHHRNDRPRPHVPPAPAVLSRDLPPITVIVPTRNRADLLKTCITGIARTDYPDVDVIIVDNDSDDPETLSFLAGLEPARHRVIRHPGAFNYSAINNRAVEQARTPLLCLLNNDIEVIEPGWLATLAVQAVREDVGAVGARLLYPDGRIQHAGVVIGMGNAAGHAHRFLRPEEEGYFHRHALPQFTSAVTAACLVVERERFLAVGGLDERLFPVAFNDVDLCMRLNRRGWQSFYEPRATLIHHESVSRGFDRDPAGAARFAGELAALKQRWGTDTAVDPFHHPQLSRASELFVVDL